MNHEGMDHGSMGNMDMNNMGGMEPASASPTPEMGSGMGGHETTTTMGMGGGGHHGSSSVPFFTFNLPVYLLFQQWLITTQEELAAACVGSFLLAVLYEGLKALREFILRKKQIKTSSKSKLRSFCCGWHLLQSIFQVIQTTAGMFLMLIFMTFHAWLAISVSLGSGVGHLLFGWLRSTVGLNDMDHCN